MTLFASVLVPPLAMQLTYEVNEELRESLQIGDRVIVPLGRRKAGGFIVSLDSTREASDFEVKQIIGRDGSTPCFLPMQLEFFTWVAQYYGDSLSNVLELAVPQRPPTKVARTVRLISAAQSEAKLGKAQRRVCEILEQCGGILDYTTLTRQAPGCSAAVQSLVKNGLLEIDSCEDTDAHLKTGAVAEWAKTAVTLNNVQSDALKLINEAITAKLPHPFVLHGVTGSGKTEVYIEAVHHALEQDQGALVIVPEIALTPQLIERFRARLGQNIAILHSGLSKRVRWDSWRALLEGRCRLAIGARSAIFAPVRNLGLIIVDEEHDSSFKQGEGLRYHARDLAVVRGNMERCPIVLGSATPSLESFHHAREKRYTYLSLPTRQSIGKPLEIEIVDLNSLKPWDMVSRNISPVLHDALRETISRGEQVFILYNRRGFANYLQCEKCEYVCECPNCSVTLTYHQRRNSLLCHYCSYAIVPSTYCSSCATATAAAREEPARLVHRGSGTEKVFEELRELFPTTAIDRLDRDVASKLDDYREKLDRMRTGATQVLVGTQMIAKGHDLPNVTLVGVADCDVGLHMPDFRAGERVFQLLTQASGRAGRGATAGRVILQTRLPKHPSIERTKRQDFEGFADAELAARRQLSYPPFTRLLRIVAQSQDAQLPQEFLNACRTQIEGFREQQKEKLAILGPAPAPLERLKGESRWHLLLKSQSARTLNRILRGLKSGTPKSTRLKVTYDLDPQDML